MKLEVVYDALVSHWQLELLSDQEEWLAAIRTRTEQATPGPWRWEDWNEDDGPHEFTLVAPPWTREGYRPNDWFSNLGNDLLTDEEKSISEKDKAFIAASREDIPFLLARLEHLSALISQASDFLEEATTGYGYGAPGLVAWLEIVEQEGLMFYQVASKGGGGG